ncbi:type II toxin-antitoxin system RelE/ParE family toxin [Pseudoxanthomonas mexicana]
MAIQSFRCRDTESLFNGNEVSAFQGFDRVAMRKLAMLHAADTLLDLRSPPGNRLEALSGDRAGQYSVRINAQYRLCFRWSQAGPEDVEICDYH